MKKWYYICLALTLFACDSEDVNDCFQTAGDMARVELTVPTFDRIRVNDLLELVIVEGPEQRVEVETGENLLNDITATVVDGQLLLNNNNQCNFVRDFGISKVIVTTPVLTEIRSATRFDVRSEGVLTFPDITLFSDTFFAPETAAVGNFYLNIDNESVRVVFNNLSNLFIQGRTQNFEVRFAAGNSRLEGHNFIADRIDIFQRSSNDMIVHPINAITGSILSTGNVIAVNRPELVDVEQPYRGRLIFQD